MSNPEYNPASGLPHNVTYGGPSSFGTPLQLSFTDHVTGSTFYIPASQADFAGILAAATIKRKEFRKSYTMSMEDVLAMFPQEVTQ